jgi:hypothetical protein
MTEFEFLKEMEASQKSFEKLNYIFIRDMHKYIRKSNVYDSTFFKTIINFSANITLTAAWIKLLKDFNSDKYNNILRFSPDFNHSTGVPEQVRPLTDAIKKSVGQQHHR